MLLSSIMSKDIAEIETVSINITRSGYKYHDTHNPTYHYSLTLDGKTITQTTYRAYAHMIKMKDKFKINNNVEYKMEVIKTLNGSTESYILEGVVDMEHTTISSHNENIFVEFTFCHDVYLLCSCFVKSNGFIVSPPN